MFRFASSDLPPGATAMRARVREFLAAERAAGHWQPTTNCWMQADAEFSRRCGAAGFIGLALPTAYGGHGRSLLERYGVFEEMLAAGAPVGLHWIADRQSGPQIARHGSEALRRKVLPRIVAGECCIGIGMSEPGAGSDLAAVRTRAVAVAGGWKLSGSKLWTSHAHRAQYAIVLARSGSGPLEADRHAGLTQFLVDMSSPGVTPRPIADLTGGRDFNEVVLDEVFVPDEAVLGQPDEGWSLVMGELAWERSGPERFLSSQPLLEVFLALVRQGAVAADDATVRTLGAQAARLAVLRQMSLSLAHQLERGDRVDVEAALVKDVGATYERAVPDAVRTLAPDALDQLPQLGAALLAAPSYSLRGGTREILRGIIAKRLEVR